MYSDDKFDISVAEGTQKLAKPMGFDLVLYEKYAEHATDFTSILTKIKVKKAISSTELDTIYGHVGFSDDGQIKGTSVVLQIQDGKIYQVFPNGAREAEFPVKCWKNRAM